MTLLLVILLVVFIISLFYRPVGTGYYSFGPSILLVVLVIVVLLFLLGVI